MTDTRQLAHQLIADGFLKFAAAENLEALTAELTAGNIWIMHDERVKRSFAADAEALAEGGIGSFMDEVGPHLLVRDAATPAIEDEFVEGSSYWINVNGISRPVYSAVDLAADEKGQKPGLCWGLATVATFTLLNETLEQGGLVERAYAVNGGHDLFCVFLTPEQLSLLAQFSAGASVKDLPYTVTSHYPDFGFPAFEASGPKTSINGAKEEKPTR